MSINRNHLHSLKLGKAGLYIKRPPCTKWKRVREAKEKSKQVLFSYSIMEDYSILNEWYLNKELYFLWNRTIFSQNTSFCQSNWHDFIWCMGKYYSLQDTQFCMWNVFIYDIILDNCQKDYFSNYVERW